MDPNAPPPGTTVEDTDPALVDTRPVEPRSVLDEALAEAVLRVRNEPARAADCFTAMRDTLVSAPDPQTCRDLLKKLVATALSAWTPPTSDPEGFAAAARDAGFLVQICGAGKHPGPAVVRELAYPVATSSPLFRSLCRSFADDVLVPVRRHLALTSSKSDAATRAFVEHLPALVRAGSREAPLTPQGASTSRFVIGADET